MAKKKSDIEKLMETAQEHKITCKCGTKTTFYEFEGKDKKICKGCHNYIFISKGKELEYRLKEMKLI